MANYATYQAIYGAIAIIPIFLFWLYVTWLIVLLGAVIAYAIQYPQEVKLKEDDGFDRRAYITYYGLRVAVETARSFITGKGALDPEALQDRLSITAEFYLEIVKELHAAGYVEQVEGEERILLARAPDEITVAELMVAFNAEALAAPRGDNDPVRNRISTLFDDARGGMANRTEGVTLLSLAQEMEAEGEELSAKQDIENRAQPEGLAT